MQGMARVSLGHPAQALETTKQGHIPSSLARLQEACERLSSTANTMEERLGSILRPHDPGIEAEKNPGDKLRIAPLAEVLDSYTKRIHDTVTLMDYILSRVEL